MVWPQIPRLDATPHTAATASLSSIAYRDGKLGDLTDIYDHTNYKAGHWGLASATLGEAFCRAVVTRTLNTGRKPLVPSFGTDARLVVEHCLEAEDLRHKRDKQLTQIGAVTGLLFLPGTLIWLLAFQIRYRANPTRQSVYGGAALTVAVLLAVLFAWKPFAHGYAGVYVRVMMLVPVIGWLIAYRICLRTAQLMHNRWNSVLEGSGGGPLVPDAVPIGPEDEKAKHLRTMLEAMGEEQHTNVLHYAGAKGILGMGRRWGSWALTEQLDPKEGVAEIRSFHPWDVVRKIEEHLNRLSRTTMANNGIPNLKVQNWIISDIPEGADEISRPSGPEMDGYRMRPAAVAELANRQMYGDGPRQRLGAQCVLMNGKLVVSLLIEVRLLAHTLQIKVHGHTLGPLAPLFDKKAKPPEKSVPKQFKFWENTTVVGSIMNGQEVVRLSIRAPFTWPWTHTLLDWLGGTLTLPEPFGLRSAWAHPSWTSHFMAEDATVLVAPVLRAVHKASLEVLADHDVDIERFTNRASLLSMEIQGVRPMKADEYDAL